MKKIIATITLLTMIIGFGATEVLAAPPAGNPPDPDNPNVIVFHNGGYHIIPTAPENRTPENWYLVLEGKDLIMRNGKSGNFQQWFINGEVGYHSVWKVTKNGKCSAKAEVIVGGWGDYMDKNATYCVMTNKFRGIMPPSWQ